MEVAAAGAAAAPGDVSMRLPQLRITLRRLMAVVAVIASTLAAWDWAEQAYEARRFREARDHAFTTGEVMRVDRAAGRVVLGLGSDDGIGIGEELYLYRNGSPPQGIGRVHISALGADQSEGQLLSTARRVRVGDSVFSVVATKPVLGCATHRLTIFPDRRTWSWTRRSSSGHE